MASRKCNGTRSHRGHAIGAGPAGGIGGVAPDGGCSAQSRAANYAGKWLANSCPAPRPEKQRLCGQSPRRYHSASNGKSFKPIMSIGECTSYEVIDHPNAVVGSTPASLATNHQGDFRCEDAR